MINTMFKTFIISALIFSFSAVAKPEVDTKNPYNLVQSVANDLFKRITKEQVNIEKDPEILRVVVEEQLAPSINHKYAAAMVLGPHYRKITDQQKEDFFNAFKEYLVATYAGILTLYKDQQVIFEPGSDFDDKKIVVVKTRVLDEGKPDIRLDFKLRLNNRTGEWSAYDMVAEGVSVLDSKRAELQNLIRQQGVESVTELLLDKAKKPIEVKTIGSEDS